MCFFSSLLGICDNSCVGKNRKFNPKGVTSQHWNSLGVNGDGGEGLPASQHLLAGEERQQGLCLGSGIPCTAGLEYKPFLSAFSLLPNENGNQELYLQGGKGEGVGWMLSKM